MPLFVTNELILSAGVMTGTNTLTSSVVNLSQSSHFSVQAVWSAGSTPVGNIFVQASLDNSTFTQIATQAVSGNTGSYLLATPNSSYPYIRVIYTNTSGTGTLNIRCASKV